MLLTANGSSTGLTIPGRADMFRGTTGVGAANRSGIVWQDAHDTHPTQFDPWEIADNALSGPVTVRESGVPDQDDPIYPIDPGTGMRYGPNLVSHRLMWFDCGQDDDFVIDLSWNVVEGPYAFMQVGAGFGFDLTAPNFENGCLYNYDVSQFGSYWQNVPMTPDVASCKDPDFYTNLGGSVPMDISPVGVHWWRLVVADGSMQAFFNGVARHAPIARPAFTVGRTTVGIHAVPIAWPPDPNYVGGAAIWNQLVCDPLASAVVPSFIWTPLT